MNNLCIGLKKSGVVCNRKSKFIIDDKYYCGTHYKKEVKEEDVKEEVEEEVEEEVKEDVKEEVKENDLDINPIILETIEKKINFKFIKFLNKGTFWSVYLATNNIDNKQYIIKLVNHTTDNSQVRKKERDLIYWEYMVLSKLNNHNNIIKLYDGKNNYIHINSPEFNLALIITECYKETLLERFDRLGNILTSGQIKNYGIQLVNTLKFLHSKGYMYVDFKLSNIMFKNEETENLTIVDFISCTKYVNVQCIHYEQKSFMKPVGNELFSSIHCSNCKLSDRAGDIQSVGYILLYLYSNTLPWAKCKSSKKILNMKRNIESLDLFNESPEFIKKFIIESNIYPFSDKPYYNNFIKILTN